eukprot:gb/GEZN01003657.1/.p1 GENE.gb/GEZN01003657.1/~~gb/GEZN01003657.1/.p1  ORF type:complete len:617 (-),score=116.13 gb/GEZN01003657.1/:198-2048(-)
MSRKDVKEAADKPNSNSSSFTSRPVAPKNKQSLPPRSRAELADITTTLRNVTLPHAFEFLDLAQQKPWIDQGLALGLTTYDTQTRNETRHDPSAMAGQPLLGNRVRWARLFKGPVHKNHQDPTKVPLLMGEMMEDERHKKKVERKKRFITAFADRLFKYNRPLDGSPLGEIMLGKETEVSFDPASLSIQIINSQQGKKVTAWELIVPYLAHFEVWNAFLLSRQICLRSEDSRLTHLLESKQVFWRVPDKAKVVPGSPVATPVKGERLSDPQELGAAAPSALSPPPAAAATTTNPAPSQIATATSDNRWAATQNQKQDIKQEQANQQIIELDLRGTALSLHEASGSLAIILREARVELWLMLQHSGVQAEHLNQIFLAISQNKQRRVTTLNLSENQQLGSVPAAYGAWTSCVSLHKVLLADCTLEDQGFVKQLADMEEKKQQAVCELQVLDLSRNNLTGTGCVALLSILRGGTCRGLRILDLTENPIRDEGLLALVEALPEFPLLQEVYLAQTQITDGAVLALCQHIQQIPNLRVLDLSNNPGITQTAVRDLSYLAPRCPNLRRLLYPTNTTAPAPEGARDHSDRDLTKSEEEEREPKETLDESSLSTLRLLASLGS